MTANESPCAAVTGGSGNLGRSTIDELQSHGYDVRSLDRAAPTETPCPFFQVDMTDLGQVAGALKGCDSLALTWTLTCR